MISVPKNQVISATAQLVPNILRPVVPCIPGLVNKSEILLQKERQALTNSSLAKSSISYPTSVTTGIGMKTQIRFVHTEVNFPNKNYYRNSAGKDVTKTPDTTGSKGYRYMILGGGAVGAAYFAQKLVRGAIGSLNISQDILALGKTEIDLAEVPEGKTMSFKWRGKPLFVRHRTQQEIDTETSVDLSKLRDPQHDADRAQRPEWLVVLGICTHLGCIPLADAGNYGGYFCPCHGSHYDGSGRIRKGPAPLNLEVPFYTFTDDNRMIIG